MVDLTTAMRRLHATTLLVLALLAALLTAPAAQAVEPGVVSDLTWGTSAADQDRTAAAIEDLGAKWVRVEINWAEAEPERGVHHAWSFEQYDRAVALARGAGARVVIMVGKAPAWASGSTDQGTPPRDVSDYARFVRHVADRYAGDGVDAYEIWNEPNIARFWRPAPSAAGYTQLLAAASAEVRAADPEAKVVFGGLSTNDYEFVEAAYAAGAGPHFDVMSVHPYTCAAAPAVVARRGDGRISPNSFLGYREVRAAMEARGDRKPIWFTEFGWSTSSEECGVPEATQAAFLTEALALADEDPYVGAALWYNLRNNYWEGDSNAYEAQFGLLSTRFAKKAGYAALRAWGHGERPAAPAPEPVAAPAAAPAPPVLGTAAAGRPTVESAAVAAAKLPPAGRPAAATTASSGKPKKPCARKRGKARSRCLKKAKRARAAAARAARR